MSATPLAGRNALVLGVERPAGRYAAVALAEAGADVAVVTISLDTKAEFAANSTANEFWALGRKGIALTSDGERTTIEAAIDDARDALGPISILVWHALPLEDGAPAGLRSDPAVVVLVGDGETPEAARALVAWTQELAAAGLRANALMTTRALADAAGVSTDARSSSPAMSIAEAVVFLASDASAAIEGTVLVAEG